MFFAQREIFHIIAASSQTKTTRATIICWVDVVIAKLSSAIVTLVSANTEASLEDLPSLSKRREDDMLRAASQLPCEHICHFSKYLSTDDVGAQTTGRMFRR